MCFFFILYKFTGGPLAEARAHVQRQCLTALISLTRAEPAATCQAVLDVNGCTTIAEVRDTFSNYEKKNKLVVC